jgi:hypothetical protein
MGVSRRALYGFSFIEPLLQIYEPGCLHVVVTFKIPDILQDQPDGMHISEIAEKSGIEQGKLGRILRLLVSKHIFREGTILLFIMQGLRNLSSTLRSVSQDVFANNRLSIQLLSTNPLSGLALHL